MTQKVKEAIMWNGKGKDLTGKRKALFWSGLVLLLILYMTAVILTPRVSQSQEVIFLGETRLPVATVAGVLTSLANICIILIVMYYGKPGYLFAMIILLVQMPLWLGRMIFYRNIASLPGIFSSLLTVTAIVLIHARNKQVERYRKAEVDQLKEQKELSQRLFEQTTTALVTAIDAKDKYSLGHSLRVADYAKDIAKRMGKTEEECGRVYYAAMLHDVGKIGIPDSIINKKGELTEREYDVVRRHPVMGYHILSSIHEYPYLSIGAHYHHEWYDGTGYPDGLKGERIPEIARIITVADAYDVMTSRRSYRDANPQAEVREEILKGAGTQFDPEIAQIMVDLIDQDTGYRLRENKSNAARDPFVMKEGTKE
jgi:hypothetical protein